MELDYAQSFAVDFSPEGYARISIDQEKLAEDRPEVVYHILPVKPRGGAQILRAALFPFFLLL